jgi:hypothetical protein
MPVSRAKVVQNPGVRATHLVGTVPPRVVPAPATGSQPLAWTVTGCSVRPDAVKTSWYPPPTLIGQLRLPCGIAGRPQTARARARAFARSRTAIRGTVRGSGLDWPTWLSDGSRVTRTALTAAGSAHTDLRATGLLPGRPAGDWPAGDWPVPGWLAPTGCAAPARTGPQPDRAAAAMTTNPAAAADGVRLDIRISIFAIRVRRPAGANGSRIRRRPASRPAHSPAGQTPAACMPRSSCFSSLISSLNLAASSN